MSANKGNKRSFHIPFACDLMQKLPTQVLAECAAFDAGFRLLSVWITTALIAVKQTDCLFEGPQPNIKAMRLL